MRGILSEHRHRYEGRGGQEFRPRVCYLRYGLPDVGVYTRRSEYRSMWLGRKGRRNHVPRLERRFRGLRRAVEHVAEGQEMNRGLLKGVLDEVMGS